MGYFRKTNLDFATDKIITGGVGMGWVKILDAGPEDWELVDLFKVMKKCLGEGIGEEQREEQTERGIKEASHV